MTVLQLPPDHLVALIGCSGSGKSTFARRHFGRYQVVSSDACRGLVADDEDDQDATPDAFDVLYLIADKRLSHHRLTVIDATNVSGFARRQVLACARRHDVGCVAIVLHPPVEVCTARASERPGRPVAAEVVRAQHSLLTEALSGLEQEGFGPVYLLRSDAEVAAAVIDLAGPSEALSL